MANRPEVFVHQPAFAEGMQKALDIPGEAFGFAEPRVQLGFSALDLTEHEFKFLFSTRTFAAGIAAPAVVARPAIATIQNPANSQRLLRVRRIILSNPSAALSLFWGTLASAAVPAIQDTVIPSIGVRDSRIQNAVGVAGNSAALARWGSTAAAPSVGELVTLPLGQFVALDVQCTVHPGGWFYVAGGTANVSVNISIMWDERLATGQELNFPGS